MKAFLISLLCLFISNACNTASEVSSTPISSQTSKTIYRGLSFVAPPDPFGNDPMQEVMAVSADCIAVIPFAYTRKGSPSVRYNESGWQWWGERPEGVDKTLELAKENKIKVLLKPQVYVVGSWPGGLEFSNNDWAKWEKDYEAYILPMVDLAVKHDVEMFCVGTEFKMSVKKREHFWRQLIAKIRKKYNGKLGYASNWDAYQNVPFWDALDYVGINAYFPLVNKKTPTVDELKSAWQSKKNRISKFYKEVNKPILFTEFGYLSVDGCAHNTWELESKVKSLAINEEAQANAIEALFAVFWNEPSWHGGFIWKWFPNMKGHEGYVKRDYTPQNKKGYEVLKKWYSK